MRAIRTSGLMSGDGKRSDAAWPQATAPVLDSTNNSQASTGNRALRPIEVLVTARSLQPRNTTLCGKGRMAPGDTGRPAELLAQVDDLDPPIDAALRVLAVDEFPLAEPDRLQPVRTA